MICLSSVSAVSDLDSDVVEVGDGNLAVDNKDISDVLKSSNDDVLSAGNNWYVKAGSTGGDGSQDNPYGDLNSALANSNLHEGDTIYVMKGTYKGTSNTGLTISKNNLTIEALDDNVIFDAENSRQIFKITGNDVLLKGLSLTKGKATNGAALYIDGDNVCVDHCTLTSNNANSGRGGAVYIADHSGISIINSTISSNKATYMGAGIYNLAKNTQIADCYLYNDISRNGGGICSSNKIKIVNSKVFSCKNDIVGTYGGGIYLTGSGASYSVIDNVEFTSCYSDQGGAIALKDCSDIIINNCDIANSIGITSTGNAANSDGAAIWMNSKNTLINNTKIHDSVSYGYSVVYVETEAVGSTFNNCTFLRNSASGYHGGAIYTKANDITVSNSYFERNHASINGGGILVRTGENVLIKNTEFVGNYAARGGAIYFYSVVTNPKIDNCIFKQNGVFPQVLGDNVTKGGAVYSSAKNTEIFKSYFEGNVGLSSGGIQLVGNYNTIEECTFKSNIANRYGGGAISSGSISDNVTNCKFISNIAQGYGGAISMNYVTVKDSVFTDNKANLGGAIYTINATVSGCEFNDNIAENNWVVVGENKLELSNNRNLEELVIIDDLLGAGIEQIPVQFGHNDVIKAVYNKTTGESHVEGYSAFCVENLTDAPTFGVIRGDLLGVKNSLTEESVGEYLKLLVYYHYDKNTNYKDFQTLVNIFTDTNYAESNDATVKDVIARYNAGERIPDELVIKNDDGSITQYVFKSLIVPQATQNLLLFNISNHKPNMTVEKIALNKTVNLGDEVTFVINVTNTGDFRLTSITVNEDIPKGLQYNGKFKGVNWTNTGSKFIYNGILNPNESVCLNITFIAVGNGTWINKVNVTSNETENKTANNNTTVFKPDLKVEKITLTSEVKVGELTSFKIIVTNTGDCKLGDIFVVEKSYEGLVYDSYDGDKWTKQGDKFIYDGVLNPGESAFFTIFFKTIKEGNFTNIVVAGSNITNNETTNNTTSVVDNKTKQPSDKINKTNKTTPKVQKEVKANSKRATGNPILALLAVLSIIGVSRFRKSKK